MDTVKAIPENIVEGAWDFISNETNEKEIVSENEAFIKAQPHIADFISMIAEDLSEPAAGDLFMLSFLTWKSFADFYGESLKEVAVTDIESGFKQASEELMAVSEPQEGEKEPQEIELFDVTQKYLLMTLIDALSGEVVDDEGKVVGEEFSDEEAGFMLIALKTQISALEKSLVLN